MRDSGGAAPAPSMQVRFWGVRGSIPTPTPGNLGYGGNTPCVEIALSTGEVFIFDAGTGIRDLGIELLKNRVPCDNVNIFLTHFHWDHLQGLPFFLPLYAKANTITFHSARPVAQLREILRGQMATPYFPVHFDLLAAEMQFAQITGKPTAFDEVKISSFALTHPEGANGYKVSVGSTTVVYATDHEHGIAAADERLLEAARGADVLIYDAQFTPEEYPTHAGWGHGTWLEAVNVAKRAGVKQLVLFHHDPGHDDKRMDQIVERAKTYFPNTCAATEGMTLQAG
jgi:phosphoribosyl 1,2-cyclic phosphodiesterase